MKILLFDNSALLKSGDDYCLESGTGSFAKELVSMGHNVAVYGQYLSNIKNTTDVYPLKKNGIGVIPVRRLNNKVLSYLRLYFLAIKHIINSDFVYFYYPTALKYLMLFCIIFRKKYGIYIRGIDDLKNPESVFFYKNSSFVLTVADYFTNYVNEIVKRNIAFNIRPMIFLSEDNIQWKRQFQHGDFLNILYMGRMTDDKGIKELINAISYIKNMGLKVKAYLVGSGEYIEELKKLAFSLDLGEEIAFTGAIFDKAEIIKYHEAAHLFILPSYHEGFPRTIYEAMILGTPIITTFVGGISGVMVDKRNCYRIEEKSIESIVAAILYANDNYEEFISYSNNSKSDVKEILTRRNLSHAELLDSLVSKLI